MQDDYDSENEIEDALLEAYYGTEEEEEDE
jgi:hypothetical protein